MKLRNARRRENALSREQIINASIELLDVNGESGLTFRALSERLATGAGALYWHVSNKSDLLTAACDVIINRAVNAPSVEDSPLSILRLIALSVFDAIEAHPWVGFAVTRASGQSPAVRILEIIGQQVRALGVPDAEQWATASALLSYILGAGSQNADRTHAARSEGLERSNFLEAMATAWAGLDRDQYPFTSSMAHALHNHDDRTDFLAGVDLILGGLCERHQLSLGGRK